MLGKIKLLPSVNFTVNMSLVESCWCKVGRHTYNINMPCLSRVIRTVESVRFVLVNAYKFCSRKHQCLHTWLIWVYERVSTFRFLRGCTGEVIENSYCLPLFLFSKCVLWKVATTKEVVLFLRRKKSDHFHRSILNVWYGLRWYGNVQIIKIKIIILLGLPSQLMILCYDSFHC